MDFSVPDATVRVSGKAQKVCMIGLYHVPRHHLLLLVVEVALDGVLVRPRSWYVPVRSMRNNKMSKERMKNNIKLNLEFPSLGSCGSVCFVNKHFARNVTVASRSLLCCVAVAVLGKVSYNLESAAAQNMLCQTNCSEALSFLSKGRTKKLLNSSL